MDEHAPRLVEQFFRADASHSRRTGGTGLGVSIVLAVAEALGGNAVATPLPAGGLEVRISLPRTGGMVSERVG